MYVKLLVWNLNYAYNAHFRSLFVIIYTKIRNQSMILMIRKILDVLFQERNF